MECGGSQSVRHARHDCRGRIRSADRALHDGSQHRLQGAAGACLLRARGLTVRVGAASSFFVTPTGIGRRRLATRLFRLLALCLLIAHFLLVLLVAAATVAFGHVDRVPR